MNRKDVASRVGEALAQEIYDGTGETPKIVMRPDDGSVTIQDDEGLLIQHFGIRFCCQYHCYHDILRDASVKVFEMFGATMAAAIIIFRPEH